jgi:hypothetical protein
LDSGKQVRVFVRQSVWDAKETLRPYFDAHVEFRPSKNISDKRVFDVIDTIRKRITGNWLSTFNIPSDILAFLSEQLHFSLNQPDNPEVDKLDRILAKQAIRAFNEPLVTRLIDGIQAQSIYIDDAENFEDAVQLFLPHLMRFAGYDSSRVFHEFMNNAAILDFETPHVFGPSRVTGKYTSRLPSLEQEMHPDWQESIRKLNELAIETHRSWAQFIELVRNKWPDLILELHETTK